jgi:hypothetical protein
MAEPTERDAVGGTPVRLLIRRHGGGGAVAVAPVLPARRGHPVVAVRRQHPLPGTDRRGARGVAFRRAPLFRNATDCGAGADNGTAANVCDPWLVHIAITLDEEYLRGSVAAVHPVVQHARCPESVFFYFLVSEPGLGDLVRAVFPQLQFKAYYLDLVRVRGLISTSVRQALEQSLNYARNYLAELLEPCVRRAIYLDSDLVLVDDIAKLWRTGLGGRTVDALEYWHTNFTKYFTGRFWSDQQFARTFVGRRSCYFNTGVMVLDLERWRQAGYTQRIERWMEVQKPLMKGGMRPETGSPHMGDLSPMGAKLPAICTVGSAVLGSPWGRSRTLATNPSSNASSAAAAAR